MPEIVDYMREILERKAAASACCPLEIQIELQENMIGGFGLRVLCDFLSEAFSTHRVCCSLLKLWKNRINDEGASAISKWLKKTAQIFCPQEIHLSHNKITTCGAILIFKSLIPFVEQKFYPFKYREFFNPLWLRLEWNAGIKVSAAIDFLKENKIFFCDAKDRNECGATMCNKSNKSSFVSPLHLFFFKPEAQYVPLSAESLEEEDAPLRIFLDTNSVIKMMEEQNSFTFKSLLDKHCNSKACVLYITQTVFSEMDNLKKRFKQARLFLSEIESSGYLNHLVSTQVLKVLSSDSEFLTQSLKKVANEDQSIVHVVAYFAWKLKGKAKVLFLSNDSYARVYSKSSGVASCSWDKLNENIQKANFSSEWDSNFLLNCIPKKAFLSPHSNDPLPPPAKPTNIENLLLEDVSLVTRMREALLKLSVDSRNSSVDDSVSDLIKEAAVFLEERDQFLHAAKQEPLFYEDDNEEDNQPAKTKEEN